MCKCLEVRLSWESLGTWVAVVPVIKTYEYFLDTVCRVASGVEVALEVHMVWIRRLSVLMRCGPDITKVVQSDVHVRRSVD